jgi:hypothetical protein
MLLRQTAYRGFTRDATITGWNVWAGCRGGAPFCPLYLQVWRHQSGRTYTLVGQTHVTPDAVARLHTIQLPQDQYISAQAGDILGLYWTGLSSVRCKFQLVGNPGCPNTGARAVFTKTVTVEVGASKVVGTVASKCKEYSVNAIFQEV